MPTIPDDMSAQELIQNGQSAFENGNYKMALRYFNAVVERYDDDPAVYIEAKYEIGHLYMKRKKYKAAVPILEEIRDIYPQVPPGTLPAAYEKLAKLELAKLSEEQLAKIHAELEKEAAATEKASAKATSNAPRANDSTSPAPGSATAPVATEPEANDSTFQAPAAPAPASESDAVPSATESEAAAPQAADAQTAE